MNQPTTTPTDTTLVLIWGEHRFPEGQRPYPRLLAADSASGAEVEVIAPTRRQALARALALLTANNQ